MLALVLAPSLLVATVTKAQTFAAVKTAVAPARATAFDVPPWAGALTATGFADVARRAPAARETVARLLYDDRFLYVAFTCRQAGVPLTRAQYANNAGVATDDHVTFAFDTSENGARTYTFSVTPRGVRDEASSENARFAPRWDAVASVSSDGDWAALLVVPLAVVRRANVPVQRWRFNFVRFVAATNDLFSWASDDLQTDPLAPQFWPWLTDLHIAGTRERPRPAADVYALGAVGPDRRVFQDGAGAFRAVAPRPFGADVTVPLTDTVSAVGTIDPDFSSVEQDQTQIAPQEFQRFLTEYRPFFAQGAAYVNAIPGFGFTGPADQMFYTPSIGIFGRGVKLEGTAGRNSFGALNVAGPNLNDTALGYAYVRPDNSLYVWAQAVRARHGAVADDTDGIAAVRQNPRTGESTYVQYALEQGTNVSRPGAARSFVLGEAVNNAHGTYGFSYTDIGAEYAPVDGFTLLNDRRGPQLAWVPTQSPRGGALKSYGATIVLDRYVDHTGGFRSADVIAGVQMTTKTLWSFAANNQVSELGAQAFNLHAVSVGYRDGTPSPIDASYAFGPFGGAFVRQTAFALTRHAGPFVLSAAFGGTVESGASTDSQWLRRISLGTALGIDGNVAVQWRDVSGRGGFALPGRNLAVSVQKRFAGDDQLFIEFGTPAAPQTLNRFLVKYVRHAGGAAS